MGNTFLAEEIASMRPGYGGVAELGLVYGVFEGKKEAV